MSDAAAPAPPRAELAPLVAVEGIDGAGTTTQAARLVEWLRSRGRAAHLTREPSTGAIGQELRRVLARAGEPLDPAAVALLFAADRVDHLRREIEPARRAGQVVVSDRYLLSSLAYQSLSVPRGFVAQINRYAPAPELTLLVDVPVEVAAARRRARGGPEELFDALAVQRRVAEAYRAEAASLRAAGERIAVVDGTPPPDEVFAALAREVGALLELPL